MDKQAGKIYYVCDRKKCAPCDPDCKHTSDITHAKNFTPADTNGKYPVKAGDAEIFIERIDEIPLLPENETITIIGVDPAIGTDKTAIATCGRKYANDPEKCKKTTCGACVREEK